MLLEHSGVGKERLLLLLFFAAFWHHDTQIDGPE